MQFDPFDLISILRSHIALLYYSILKENSLIVNEANAKYYKHNMQIVKELIQIFQIQNVIFDGIGSSELGERFYNAILVHISFDCKNKFIGSSFFAKRRDLDLYCKDSLLLPPVDFSKRNVGLCSHSSRIYSPTAERSLIGGNTTSMVSRIISVFTV